MQRLEDLIYQVHENLINVDNMSEKLLPIYNELYINGYPVRHRIEELILDYQYHYLSPDEGYMTSQQLINKPVFPTIELIPKDADYKALYDVAELVYENINNGNKYEERKHRGLLANLAKFTVKK